ncbi:hypothetical protein QOZ80_5BG0434330 [Eleusine coracana subsp. coracana]|nr:hypothetical protein QOZ80_5BG0434330 [Eleusine coracana subsp. coracana]
MEADDWLKAIEKKLIIAQCNDREKVLFAAHQLYGVAADWWEAYCNANADVESITWIEFKDNFRSHYIPTGIKLLKRQEFQDLRQGDMSVSEYLNRFIQLSRYAPEDVNSDGKKQYMFMRGLQNDIQFQLINNDYVNFQKLVDKAIVVENKRNEIEREGKRKMPFQGQSYGSNTRPCMMPSSNSYYRAPSTVRPPMQAPCPNFPMQRSNYQAPHPSQQQAPCPTYQQAPRPTAPTAPQNQNRPTAGNTNGVKRGCYHCGQEGHFMGQCPQQNNAPRQASTNLPSGNRGQQNYARGSVNHVTMEEVEQATDVVLGENQVFGPEILQEAERQVKIVRENLKVAQSRQKSYADRRRRDLSFEIGDFVYLKVSPMRGVRRFKVKGKLAPRYIGPFKILDRRGEVAYQLELPSHLTDVHDVFHVSQLKKCLRVPEEQLPVEELDLRKDLTYTEQPVKILEVVERVTRNKVIRMCKVLWNHHTKEEATWEREEELKAEFPHLFINLSESRG